MARQGPWLSPPYHVTRCDDSLTKGVWKSSACPLPGLRSYQETVLRRRKKFVLLCKDSDKAFRISRTRRKSCSEALSGTIRLVARPRLPGGGRTDSGDCARTVVQRESSMAASFKAKRRPRGRIAALQGDESDDQEDKGTARAAAPRMPSSQKSRAARTSKGRVAAAMAAFSDEDEVRPSRSSRMKERLSSTSTRCRV